MSLGWDKGRILIHPVVFYLLGVSYFFVMPVIYYGSYTILNVLVFLIGSFSFLFGYLSCEINYKFYTGIRIDSSVFQLVPFLLISLLFYKYLSFEQNKNYNEYFINVSQLDLYLKVFDKLFILFIIFISSVYAIRSKFRMISVFLSFSAISVLEQARIYLVFNIIYWVFLAVYFNYFNLRFFYIIFLIPIVPFLFAFLLIKRGVSSNDYGGYSFLVSLNDILSVDRLMDLLLTSMESFDTFLIYEKIINSNFIEPASGVVRTFFMIIPRSIWSEKPEALSRLVAKEFNYSAYSNGGGISANIFGDSFVNGGFLGVFIFWFIMGFLSKFFYANTLKKIDHQIRSSSSNLILFFYYFIFLNYFIYCFRGFGSDYLWLLIFNLSMFSIIIKVLNVKFFRVNKYSDLL